jgi:DNA-binding NtrC family response regulator
MSEKHTNVLIVDDDPIVADSLAAFLAGEGYETSTCSSVTDALARVAEHPPQIILCDLSLSGENGVDLLKRLAHEHPQIATIVLTGYGSIESAVQTLRIGAVDYLTKPVVDSELRVALERARRQSTLASENTSLKRRLDAREGLASIVGNDPRMLKVYDLIQAVAPSRTSVLMTGESGVGKSLIAHAIHRASPRRDKPFVEISCGSISETLLESELFGHVKGAFTGAYADKPGRFLAAHHGTLFLDEINSASPAMQLKLLRVLQERRFEPVGSTQTIEVDVRVVLASNQPLERLVAQGQFRQDLYYRINVVNIELPPLRDRTADIPALAAHFLREHAHELGKQLVGFTPDAMNALTRYPFPGNVRELQNVIERAAVLAKRPTVALEDLPDQIASPSDDKARSFAPISHAIAHIGDEPWTPMSLEEALRAPERCIILKALRANAWNRQKTADQLGVNRTTLYKKMKLLGIDGESIDAA